MPRRRIMRDMLMNSYRMPDRARGRRMRDREDYGYDMNEYDYMRNKGYDRGSRYPFNVSGEFGRYDEHYPSYDYRMMDYRGDYGETLTREELEEWKRKLMLEVEEKDKRFFTPEMIIQKAKQMGAEMKDYDEEELTVASLMAYTDYYKALKPYIGSNMDIFIALGKAWLEDKDVAVKGGEKLAIYHDCIVEDM